MKYANRDSEYAQLEALVHNNGFPIFVEAYQASGVSSFIKEKMRPLWIQHFRSENIIYIDGKLGGRLDELLFKALLSAGHVESLQKFADAKIGIHNGSVMAALLECIPKAGPFLKCISEPKSAPPIYIGNYASVISDHLNTLASGRAQRRTRQDHLCRETGIKDGQTRC